MHGADLRKRALELRAGGASLSAIASELGIAKSTASLWLREVAMSDDLRRQLLARDPRPLEAGRRRRSDACRNRRAAAQARGRERMRRGEPLFIAGCMLHWGEGTKGPNCIELTNSDVDLMRLFVRFLRESLDVPSDRIRLTVNCFLGNGLTLDEIEGWWLERLGLPPGSLRAATVNRPSKRSKGARRRLLYGTARVTVHSTELVQQIYGAIQEYGDFERSEWLQPIRRRPPREPSSGH